MKKKIIVVSYLLLVTCSLLPAQTGIIRELRGEVELKNAGSSEYIPAQKGSIIEQNTIVSTGFRSTVIIEVGSALITVRPVTRLSLSEIQRQESSENLNVNLQTGRIKVELNSPAGTRSQARFVTPSAVASVRGTVFELDAKRLKVTEGRVIFEGANGSIVTVSAGSSSNVTAEGFLEYPAEIAESALMPNPPVGTDVTGYMAGASVVLAVNIELDFTYVVE